MNYSQHAGESTQWATTKWSPSDSWLWCSLGHCQVKWIFGTLHQYCIVLMPNKLRDWLTHNCLYPPTYCFHAVSCAGSVVLTQTHPAAPYVCRTGNITLRCQYGSVENVLGVLWGIGNETVSNPSTIPGHTAFPHTTTYQEVTVDSYTNLRERYQCTVVAMNALQSNSFTYTDTHEIEGKRKLLQYQVKVRLEQYSLLLQTFPKLSHVWVLNSIQMYLCGSVIGGNVFYLYNYYIYITNLESIDFICTSVLICF